LKHVRVQQSSISGLIAATRAATAVVGVDSGPLHVAAALHKPGAAVFGPTDPAQTGPFGGTIAVLRHPEARTTYKRDNHLHPSMHKIGPEEVKKAVMRSIALSTAAEATSKHGATRMKS
jgi:heptosyltransferase-1